MRTYTHMCLCKTDRGPLTHYRRQRGARSSCPTVTLEVRQGEREEKKKTIREKIEAKGAADRKQRKADMKED